MGEEVYCLKDDIQTYAGVDVDGTTNQRGYSHATVDERLLLRGPEALSLEKVAPLLPGRGLPLKHWAAGPGTKVAITGIGGLGHVGVELAPALGAEARVLSRTLANRDDGLKLDADRYYAPRTSRASRSWPASST